MPISLKENKYLKLLLLAGATFFIIEFFLHYFGLSILEHDKIFINTHDRYVASFTLAIGTIAILITTDLKKYHDLFILFMALVLVGIISGTIIALEGGYQTLFPVVTLDHNLSILGIGFYLWYILTWIIWLKRVK